MTATGTGGGAASERRQAAEERHDALGVVLSRLDFVVERAEKSGGIGVHAYGGRIVPVGGHFLNGSVSGAQRGVHYYRFAVPRPDGGDEEVCVDAGAATIAAGHRLSVVWVVAPRRKPVLVSLRDHGTGVHVMMFGPGEAGRGKARRLRWVGDVLSGANPLGWVLALAGTVAVAHSIASAAGYVAKFDPPGVVTIAGLLALIAGVGTFRLLRWWRARRLARRAHAFAEAGRF
jgi:hypothetical protein